MIGIYRFINNKNGKQYIGQSHNLMARYKAHKNAANSNTNYKTDVLLYRAMRKYGFDNFTYEIIIDDDTLTDDELNQLEQYYIEFYNTCMPNGYNMNYGGNFTSGLKILTKENALAIIQELLNTTCPYKKLSLQYHVAENTISAINRGVIWRQDHLTYPLRATSVNWAGEKNGRCKTDNKTIMRIREQFVTKSLPEIYNSYKDVYSFAELKKICYGVTYKNLPIYKKRTKKWYLNETCIDYPRSEE